MERARAGLAGEGGAQSGRRDEQESMQTDRKYLLERVDDAAVAQLYADGFDELPRDQKILIWHLYRAALAGRDIYFDQRHGRSLEMRDVARRDPDPPGRDRRRRSRRDRALHQAVLDQQRPLTTISPPASSS